MAREEDLKRSGAWDWDLQRPKQPAGFDDLYNKNDKEVVIYSREQPVYKAIASDLITMLVEEYYGSGKAMQVADILRGD